MHRIMLYPPSSPTVVCARTPSSVASTDIVGGKSLLCAAGCTWFHNIEFINIDICPPESIGEYPAADGLRCTVFPVFPEFLTRSGWPALHRIMLYPPSSPTVVCARTPSSVASTDIVGGKSLLCAAGCTWFHNIEFINIDICPPESIGEYPAADGLRCTVFPVFPEFLTRSGWPALHRIMLYPPSSPTVLCAWTPCSETYTHNMARF